MSVEGIVAAGDGSSADDGSLDDGRAGRSDLAGREPTTSSLNGTDLDSDVVPPLDLGDLPSLDLEPEREIASNTSRLTLAGMPVSGLRLGLQIPIPNCQRLIVDLDLDDEGPRSFDGLLAADVFGAHPKTAGAKTVPAANHVTPKPMLQRRRNLGPFVVFGVVVLVLLVGFAKVVLVDRQHPNGRKLGWPSRSATASH